MARSSVGPPAYFTESTSPLPVYPVTVPPMGKVSVTQVTTTGFAPGLPASPSPSVTLQVWGGPAGRRVTATAYLVPRAILCANENEVAPLATSRSGCPSVERTSPLPESPWMRPAMATRSSFGGAGAAGTAAAGGSMGGGGASATGAGAGATAGGAGGWGADCRDWPQATTATASTSEMARRRRGIGGRKVCAIRAPQRGPTSA